MPLHSLLRHCNDYSIGSDNGFTTTRQQAIIWTSDGKFTDTYMHHSGSMG